MERMHTDASFSHRVKEEQRFFTFIRVSFTVIRVKKKKIRYIRAIRVRSFFKRE